MTRLTLAAAATLIALAAAMPAQAGGVWYPNTAQLNGLSLNGVQPNGIAAQATGGVALLAIELPPQPR